MTNNKNTHGGSRKGSGKKKGFTKQFAVWCHPLSIAKTREFAKKQDEIVIKDKTQ